MTMSIAFYIAMFFAHLFKCICPLQLAIQSSIFFLFKFNLQSQKSMPQRYENVGVKRPFGVSH